MSDGVKDKSIAFAVDERLAGCDTWIWTVLASER